MMSTEHDDAIRTLVATLRNVCARLPGSEEYVMVHHPAFRVGKKPFAIAGLHDERKGSALSINFGVDEQQLLLDDGRFSRTPYIGQHGWVSIAQEDLRAGELESLVIDSWRRIASKRQLAEHDAAEQPKPSVAKARRARPAAAPKRRTASR
jgi:predicted DNA-binding protein (MmcQ/YjbR family)